MNKNNEYWQKRTLWYSYVFDHKMRTRNNWSAVEPIWETRMVGKLHEKAWTLEILELWNPGPLVRPKCIEKMIRRHSFRGLGSKVEIIFPFKVPSRFSHYPSFQNGLNDISVIFSSHFMSKNINTTIKSVLCNFFNFRAISKHHIRE